MPLFDGLTPLASTPSPTVAPLTELDRSTLFGFGTPATANVGELPVSFVPEELGLSSLGTSFSPSLISTATATNRGVGPVQVGAGTSASGGAALQAIRQIESGGNYGAFNPNDPQGGAKGAYQFLQGTWELALRQAGLSLTQYPDARWAPPEIQDAAANAHFNYLLELANGDVSLAIAGWNGGPGVITNPGANPIPYGYVNKVLGVL